MLTNEQVLDILKEKDAVLEGHFLLTSGRHSDRYVQCAKLFQYADTSAKICESLAEGLKDMDIDAVVSPAVGGILMGYEMGRQLGVRNIFTERVEGKMALRRGFTVAQGEKLLVVEDVVTTGGSVKEVIALMRELGAEIVGVASVVDRSAGKVDFGVPYKAALSMEVVSFEPEECELCKVGSKPVKPGSRNIN